MCPDHTSMWAAGSCQRSQHLAWGRYKPLCTLAFLVSGQCHVTSHSFAAAMAVTAHMKLCCHDIAADITETSTHCAPSAGQHCSDTAHISRPCIYSSIYPFIFFVHHPSIHASIHPSMPPSIYPPTHPSVCPSVHPSIHSWLSVHRQQFAGSGQAAGPTLLCAPLPVPRQSPAGGGIPPLADPLPGPDLLP